MKIKNELIAEIYRKIAILENSDNQKLINEIRGLLCLLDAIIEDEF